MIRIPRHGRIVSAAIAVATAASLLVTASAQSPPAAGMETLPIKGQVTLISSGDLNTVVQIGAQGVVVVDTMAANLADPLLRAIESAARGRPIRYLINTSASPQATGGNVKIAEAGSQLVAGNFAAQLGQAGAQSAFVVAHENVLKAMSAPEGSVPAAPFAAWPTETYFLPSYDLYFNGEAIQLFHPADGVTNGDSLVFFRSSDVLVTGDVFRTTGFPPIDRSRGGSVNGVLESLNTIIDIAVSEMFTEGGTVIVPGRGRLTDEFDVVEYRDMITIIRDRVDGMVKKGQTLEQVRAARPAFEYEKRFGSGGGEWTTAQFIEAVYRSLAPATGSR